MKKVKLEIYECGVCGGEFTAPKVLQESVVECPHCGESVLLEASGVSGVEADQSASLAKLKALLEAVDFSNPREAVEGLLTLTQALTDCLSDLKRLVKSRSAPQEVRDVMLLYDQASKIQKQIKSRLDSFERVGHNTAILVAHEVAGLLSYYKEIREQSKHPDLYAVSDRVVNWGYTLLNEIRSGLLNETPKERIARALSTPAKYIEHPEDLPEPMLKKTPKRSRRAPLVARRVPRYKPGYK